MTSASQMPNVAIKPAALPPRPKPRFAIDFEYIGQTRLMVVGPITGNRYEFQNPGARIPIDVRDMPQVEQVPNLRRVD